LAAEVSARFAYATALASLVLAGLVGAVPDRALSAGQNPSSRPVRVLLGSARDQAPLRMTSNWRLLDGQRRVIARGQGNEAWVVQRESGRLRAVNPAGTPGPWSDGLAILEPTDSGSPVSWDGRAYRGVLLYVPADTVLYVVNRLDVEDYLRGVVPLETGTGNAGDHAAVEAQAVAARSYTYTRMLYYAQRHYDIRATTADQVYRGSAPETFIGDLAVAATAGWVISYGGRVVTAPYHSTCGGSTAGAEEVWRSRGEPYLRAVSDRIPGTDRAYCDGAPRFRWERTMTGDALAAALERYARTYAQAPAGPLGVVREVKVERVTPSGRVAAIIVNTERVSLRLQGDDMRYVLRTVGGEILPSTYFLLEASAAQTGLTRLAIRGQGNGHGVGMCQWGAIGRARAGQDFRAILSAYYPGAQLMRAP
jgi:stage II sporulation protein D